MLPKNFNIQISRCVAAAISIVGVCALAAATPLKDIPANHWARASVESVTSKKLMDAPDGDFDGNKPVTRYELAVVLDRFVQYMEAGKKPLHVEPLLPPAKVSPRAGASVRLALKQLTSENFIPSDSILLKGTGKEVVTASQLEDLMSQVVSRLADRAEKTPPPD